MIDISTICVVHTYCPQTQTDCRVVVFVDEENGDVDNIPSDGDGLDGNDETSDESEADSDVSQALPSVYCKYSVWCVLVQQLTKHDVQQ